MDINPDKSFYRSACKRHEAIKACPLTLNYTRIPDKRRRKCKTYRCVNVVPITDSISVIYNMNQPTYFICKQQLINFQEIYGKSGEKHFQYLRDIID